MTNTTATSLGEREDLARFLGSFPMHDDDRGPDNTVLVDVLPFTPGEDMSGETVLYRIVDAMIERFPLLREAASVLLKERNQQDSSSREPSPQPVAATSVQPSASLATETWHERFTRLGAARDYAGLIAMLRMPVGAHR